MRSAFVERSKENLSNWNFVTKLFVCKSISSSVKNVANCQ